MSWVTVIWAMIASACLTLGGMHFLIWCRKRAAWANLFFSLGALSTAIFVGTELWIMRAQTPVDFGTAVRWAHLPMWVMLVSLTGFVWFYLGSGRAWLAWSFIGLRTLSLLLDFLTGQNLNYLEISAVRQIPFLGELASVAEGVPNPWMLVGQLSSLALIIFVTDAGVKAWRRGEPRKAIVGGSIVFFVVSGQIEAMLVFWGVLQAPIILSLFYMPIVFAMGFELSRDVLRAAQLAGELRESEERMTVVTEATDLGVWIYDLVKTEIWANEQGRALFGFTKSDSLTFNDFMQRLHSDDREAVRQTFAKAMESDGHYEAEYRVVLPPDQIRWLSSHGRVEFAQNGKPVCVRGISLDITQTKQAEQELTQHRNELAHLSRVTTVSELSGSLAHELNQPLAIILTNAQAAQRLLAQSPPDIAEAQEILTDIVSEDQRAGEVIRRLRSLLKHGETTQQPLEVNEIIDDVLRMARSDLIGRGVTVHRALAADVPKASGDRIQLQQVLLNLILNACDAMAANPRAIQQLTIATTHQNGSVRVSVSDTGCGLPPDVERVFEPFYTTKKHGLGLGLSICRSIVNAHQGRLWAENAAARGAVFHLELQAVVA